MRANLSGFKNKSRFFLQNLSGSYFVHFTKGDRPRHKTKMSFIRFTHETIRHWGDQENETCRLDCEAEVSYDGGVPGSAGVNAGFDAGHVEILSVEGPAPIMGEELQAELRGAACDAAWGQLT